MIFDNSSQIKENKKSKSKFKPLVEQVMNMKDYKKLNEQELSQFIEEHQIIHCAYFLNTSNDYFRLMKLYLLLFQVATRYSNNQSVMNFLNGHQFYQKIAQLMNDNANVFQKIVLSKISSFLDSFKIRICTKFQINSLASQYHQYRLLQNSKDEQFIVLSCQIIKQYLYHNLNFLINELEYTDWNSMNGQVFSSFYLHYSQLCTICKRVTYIKCRLMELPSFQIPSSIRTLIEQKHHKSILKEVKDQNLSICEIIDVQPKKQRVSERPNLNVKKKLKAMGNIINKMKILPN